MLFKNVYESHRANVINNKMILKKGMKFSVKSPGVVSAKEKKNEKQLCGLWIVE